MQLRMILIYRTYPLIYSNPWSFYMRIRYMQVIFYGPYLLHITRSAYILNNGLKKVKNDLKYVRSKYILEIRRIKTSLITYLANKKKLHNT